MTPEEAAAYEALKSEQRRIDREIAQSEEDEIQALARQIRERDMDESEEEEEDDGMDTDDYEAQQVAVERVKEWVNVQRATDSYDDGSPAAQDASYDDGSSAAQDST